MRIGFRHLSTLLALAACDRVTSPSVHDGGADSAASSRWEHVDAGTANFNAVAGSSPNNVFIVGDEGSILHWDGTALLPEASGTTAHLRGISVADESLAYAVGDQGTLLRRQGGAWIVDPPLGAGVLNAVYASPSFAVAVGEQGTIFTHYQGTWGQVANARNDNYYAVANASSGFLVVGTLGIVVTLDYQTRKISSTTPLTGYLKVLAGATPYGGGALLVGVDGGYFQLAGGAVTRVAGLPPKFLRAVSVVDGTAWIVGHEGLVAAGPPGSLPTLVPAPDERWLLGVYAASSTDVWVVGRSGLILRGPPGARNAIDGGTP